MEYFGDATIEDLIELLREIEAEPEIQIADVLNRGNLDDKHRLIRLATLVAEVVLLTHGVEGGRDHYAEQELMQLGGYKIHAVADEGCPWVMGAIETSKGLLGYA